MTVPVEPARVRYIKLGERGRWEDSCLKSGRIRVGFGSAEAERFALCVARRWDEVAESFLKEGKDKGTSTRFTNELRLFFEDDGSTHWSPLSASDCIAACSTRAHQLLPPIGTVWFEPSTGAGGRPTSTAIP